MKVLPPEDLLVLLLLSILLNCSIISAEVLYLARLNYKKFWYGLVSIAIYNSYIKLHKEQQNKFNLFYPQIQTQVGLTNLLCSKHPCYDMFQHSGTYIKYGQKHKLDQTDQ